MVESEAGSLADLPSSAIGESEPLLDSPQTREDVTQASGDASNVKKKKKMFASDSPGFGTKSQV